MINSNGKEVYNNFLEHFFSAHPSIKEKREFEVKNIFDFIRNRQPYVMVISSNSSRAIMLKANLYQNFKVNAITLKFLKTFFIHFLLLILLFPSKEPMQVDIMCWADTNGSVFCVSCKDLNSKG